MLNRFLPHSLFYRFLLIILIPTILVQAVAIYIFYDRHWSGVSRYMAAGLAGDVVLLANIYSDSENEGQRDELIKKISRDLYLKVNFIKNAKVTTTSNRDLDFFSEMLDGRINNKYAVNFTGDYSDITIDIEFPDGVLSILSYKKRLVNPSTYIFIMWMTGTAILFFLISIFFMKNQVRSITLLAEAAEKFGKGHDTEKFKPTGAMEVRSAAKAFMEMRERIKRQVEQRTEMLAGVSHDLKTPLTRMKLQLAMMPNSPEVEELQYDVSEMEKMIQDYLDFAKGNEKVTDSSVNIQDLLRSIVAGYKNQHDNIELQVESSIIMNINSNSFRRVLSNIIDNSLKYSNKISIKALTSEKNLILTIDDNGPGIPESKYEEVFRPFYRLDNSRNKETGGTGLGLAIAKDIIVSYGGSISLDKSPLGGLKVLIKMPT